MKTLLVLDDELSLMKLMRHMLKYYTLIEALNAEQALRLFGEHNRQVDLLIADVMLPVSSGIQVALVLRNELPNLPVILTSGFPAKTWSGTDAADLERLGSHSVAVLSKPFQSQALLQAVRTLTEAASSQSAACP